MNNNSMNMAELMAMLAKMDKKDLEHGISKDFILNRLVHSL